MIRQCWTELYSQNTKSFNKF